MNDLGPIVVSKAKSNIKVEERPKKRIRKRARVEVSVPCPKSEIRFQQSLKIPSPPETRFMRFGLDKVVQYLVSAALPLDVVSFLPLNTCLVMEYILICGIYLVSNRQFICRMYIITPMLMYIVHMA